MRKVETPFGASTGQARADETMMEIDMDKLNDILVHDHGSVVGFTPISLAASSWIDENVQTEDWQWMGPCLYVDRRPAADLLDAMLNAGLVVGS